VGSECSIQLLEPYIQESFFRKSSGFYRLLKKIQSFVMCWHETILSYEFPLQIIPSVVRAEAHNYSSRVQLFAITCSLVLALSTFLQKREKENCLLTLACKTIRL